MSQEVPVVDLSQFIFGSSFDRANFSREFGDALAASGFVRICGHPVSPSLLDGAYRAAERFFTLPAEAKLAYHNADCRTRGYVPFGAEYAADSPAPDAKEFWDIGQEFAAGHWLYSIYPKNVWPQEVAEFKEAMLFLYKMADDCAKTLLEALEAYVEAPGLLTALAADGDSILRAIHYPPFKDIAAAGSVRSSAHENTSLITLRPEATAAGLEIQARDGQWVPVHASGDELVVNSASRLSRLTDGEIPSTMHRVVNPADQSMPRFSLPFFCNPKPHDVLSVLPKYRHKGA